MKIDLKYPINNQVVCQMTKTQHSFIKTAGKRNVDKTLKIDWLHLVKQGEDNTIPAPVLFCWTMDCNKNNGVETWFDLATDPAFQDKTSCQCFGSETVVNNLFLSQTYYWRVRVVKNGKIICKSDTACFTTAHTPPRWISAEGLSNVRDIGGWSCENGKRIRQGLIFRGCEMEFHHVITDAGRKTLLYQLHIKTDLDLRGEAAGKISCSALGPNINFQLIPVKAYDEFLSENEKEVCCKVFRLFTEQKNYPFYIHCWGGADRTGTLIFLLCAMLGMSENDLYLDYELTSLSIWGERSRNAELFQAFLKVLKAYSGDTISQKSESFLLSAGMTKHELNMIRTMLIED